MKKKLFVLLLLVLIVAVTAIAVSAEDALPAQCPHCKKAVTWTPLTEDNASDEAISAGHYYLAFEGDSAEWTTKSIPKQVCLHMNGKTITSPSGVGRIFTVSGELSLIGEGTAMGRGFADTSSYGGAINVTGTLNVYGSTVTTTGEEGRTSGRGGVVYLSGSASVLNLHSGSIIGGKSANGGTLGIDTGIANIYGGTLGGGTATAAGGAVYIRAGGTLNVEGGTIQGGTAATTGGAIHAHLNSFLNISGGSITGGNSTKNGATLYIYTTNAKMTGGTVTGGKSGNGGGAMYIYKGSAFEMTGGKISGGEAKTGDCVYVPTDAQLILGGSASIELVHFSNYDPTRLTVKGECTGNVTFRGESGEAADGVVIGVSQNADLRKASYGVANTELYVIHDGEDIKISALGYVEPVETKLAYCPACQKEARWLAYGPQDYEINTYLRSGHYYVESEETTCNWKLKYVVGDDRVCLDLNGHTLVGSSRAFDITKGTLNIMDSVGGGTVTACGPTNVETIYGGTLFIRASSTVNLYGGKLTYFLPTDGRSYVTRGGVAYVRGQLNIYGGEISGGAAKAGANIYGDAGVEDGVVYVSHVGLYGGVVGENVKVPGASTSGKCVASRGTVTLSGDPQVTHLLVTSSSYTPALQERFTVEGKFTGTMEITFSEAADISCVGYAVDGDVTGATVTLVNHEDSKLAVWKDRLLCVTDSDVALIFAEDGTVASYPTAQAAVDAAGETEKIVLLADASDLVVNKTVCLDLNGFDVTNASGTGTLLCMDSKTDDFTVADGDYGKVSGTVTCAIAGITADAACTADNYLMVEEADGKSFHCVRLQIVNSVLRPSCAGVYYVSQFYGDALVAAKVSTLGVALNAYEAPTAANMHTTSLYTQQNADQFNKPGTSCLLSGIMKAEKSDADNLTRAGTTVYAGAYVKLTDGTVLFGETKSTTLQEQAAAIDTSWIDLTLVQKRAFVAMFEKYDTVMRDTSWSVSNALSIADRKILFATTDYTPYLAPWTHDVVAQAKEDGKIHYYFMAGEGLHISDGQTYKDKWGDSCLIVFPNGQTLLIDVGPLAYAPVLAKNLERMGITHLDAILITHPHSDHHNGAFSDAAVMGVGLLETITVDQVYYRGGYDLTSTAATLVKRTCADLGLPLQVMEAGMVLNFGDVRMECVWPLEGEGDAQISGGEEVNNMSIVLRFDYGEHSSLFTGDLYLDGEKMILERTDVSKLDVDFLKVPHHGYNTSSSVDFIEAVSPEISMTIGRLPIPAKVRDRYEALGSVFLDDRTNGYVEVTGSADGELKYTASRNDAVEEAPDTGEDPVPDEPED